MTASTAQMFSLLGSIRCVANAVSMSAAQRSRSTTLDGIRRTISLRVSAAGRVGTGGAVTQPASASKQSSTSGRERERHGERGIMRAAYGA